MAVIQNLAVSLTARLGKFRKGFQKAGGIVGDFSKRMGRLGRRTAAFGAGMTLAAGGALAFFTRRAMGTIDQTAKLADVLGLTTEQLAGYQQAARISGVETGSLNTGFRRLMKNVGDANDGLSTSIRAFDKLGLKAADLRGMSTDELFKTVADRLGGMTNQVDKASVALQLFGRSGLDLIKIAESGRSGIEAWQREAERLGIAFNRVDAAKVEEANDAITRLNVAFQGFMNRVAIKLAPTIERISAGLVQASMESGNFKGAIDTGFRVAVQGARFVVDAVFRIAQGFSLLGSGASRTGQFIVDMTIDAIRGFQSMGKFVGNVATLIRKSMDVAFNGIGVGLNWLNKQFSSFLQMVANLTAKMLTTVGRALSRLKGGIGQSLIALGGQMNATFGDLGAKAVKKYEDSLQALNRSIKETGEASDNLFNINVKPNAWLTEISDDLGKRTDVLMKNAMQLERSRKSFQKGISGFLSGEGSGSGGALGLAFGAMQQLDNFVNRVRSGNAGATIGAGMAAGSGAARQSFQEISRARTALDTQGPQRRERVEAPKVENLLAQILAAVRERADDGVAVLA